VAGGGGGGGGETFRVLHVQCYLWGGGGTPPICVEVCTLYLLYSKVSVQMRNSADSGGGGWGGGACAENRPVLVTTTQQKQGNMHVKIMHGCQRIFLMWI
jgi:hypothetical protein